MTDPFDEFEDKMRTEAQSIRKNWKIIREADDPLALRLSIGSPNGYDHTENGYIVYRGETQECIKLLETALAEFKQHLQEQGE